METVNITFNSHEKYKALLTKGFSEEQAEGIIDVFSEITLPNAATREDVTNSKNELKQEVVEFRNELKQEIISLKAEFNEDAGKLETRLTKLIYVNTFVIITALAALSKLL